MDVTSEHWFCWDLGGNKWGTTWEICFFFLNLYLPAKQNFFFQQDDWKSLPRFRKYCQTTFTVLKISLLFQKIGWLPLWIKCNGYTVCLSLCSFSIKIPVKEFGNNRIYMVSPHKKIMTALVCGHQPERPDTLHVWLQSLSVWLQATSKSTLVKFSPADVMQSDRLEGLTAV